MKIEQIEIEKIKPYENNPRNNDGAVDATALSISRYGFRVPIVIDANNVIICGHTRYKAAQKLGLRVVPCERADDLTPEQVREYRLADNKTAEIAEWDFSKLEEELSGIDYDMSAFGFDATISPDDFGEDFELENSDEPEMCTMSFTLHVNQRDVILAAMDAVDECTETYGNTNKNGNALFEVVRQWAEQKKLL